MHKLKPLIFDLALLFIITIPAFIRILNNQYFSMHDDQHIVRLFLLDQGIRQGYIYPRWADGLGFGFGYPLFNFYPPLFYYLAEIFHLLGFSLIWSIKLIIILAFFLGSVGIYYLVKKITDRSSALLSATLFTYFSYHAVLVYVRGAFAEFLSLVILPFVFMTLDNLSSKSNLKKGIFFGISLASLIISQPLIALPSMIFVGLMFLFYWYKSTKKELLLKYFLIGLIFALSLSAFFWLPSLTERKYTLTDQILTGELASYKLHYVYPQQFIYSPWGYGGSGEGLADGMTFQLGKIHVGLVVLALILGIINWVYLSFPRKRAIVPLGKSSYPGFLTKSGMTTDFFFFTVFLLFFSLFTTTEYSAFIWDRIKYLWYLQFPWRFMVFINLFLAIAGAYFLFFLNRLLQQLNTPHRWGGLIVGFTLIIMTIIVYQKYFKPERFIATNDKERTTKEEISWRISRTSYEFVPKGVKTKKSELNTTLLAIEKKDIPEKSFEVISGMGRVDVSENKFQNKSFLIKAETPITFRLNTYNFPGWEAYLTSPSVIPSDPDVTSGESRNLKINDENDFKLITVSIPPGNYKLNFIFEDTKVRKFASLLSLTGFSLVILMLFKKFKKVDG